MKLVDAQGRNARRITKHVSAEDYSNTDSKLDLEAIKIGLISKI